MRLSFFEEIVVVCQIFFVTLHDKLDYSANYEKSELYIHALYSCNDAFFVRDVEENQLFTRREQCATL
jgi:hypothetical protein